MADEVTSLVGETVKIATLPAIFFEINEAVDDPESSFLDIGRIISLDTSLSARLLKIVNSSFYGFPSKVETISHAITIIGTSQLRDLVLATTVINQFKGMPKDLVNMELFWAHSIACGLAARVIAVYRREPNAERYYVTGMLHDIGRLVFYLNLPDKTREMLSQSRNGHLLHEVERTTLGYDHAEVGAALLNSWKLPPRMIEAVEFHHSPLMAENYPIDVSILHLADIVAHAMELGDSGEPRVPPLDARAWDKLEIHSGLLASIIEQVDRQFNDSIQMFVHEG